MHQTRESAVFSDAEWYDRTIDWSARLGREVPVLREVFGPPGEGGLLDAGCGTGHHATALAECGYRVAAADASEEMLTVARRRAAQAGAVVTFHRASYAELFRRAGAVFDGVYCLGNSLAAAGSRERVEEAVGSFGRCLRSGGRLFIQILNVTPMRGEVPCVRGPRVTRAGGVEHLSVRHFHFTADACHVTNLTLWRDDAWRVRAHSGVLYPVTRDQMRRFCGAAGLRIDAEWGSYGREPFDAERSGDLLIVATRT